MHVLTDETIALARTVARSLLDWADEDGVVAQWATDLLEALDREPAFHVDDVRKLAEWCRDLFGKADYASPLDDDIIDTAQRVLLGLSAAGIPAKAFEKPKPAGWTAPAGWKAGEKLTEVMRDPSDAKPVVYNATGTIDPMVADSLALRVADLVAKTRGELAPLYALAKIAALAEERLTADVDPYDGDPADVVALVAARFDALEQEREASREPYPLAEGHPLTTHAWGDWASMLLRVEEQRGASGCYIPDPVRVASLRDIIERIALRDAFGLLGIASEPRSSRLDDRESALLMRASGGRSLPGGPLVEQNSEGDIVSGPHRVRWLASEAAKYEVKS